MGNLKAKIIMPQNEELDKAINPYRDDICAIKLKNIVKSNNYVAPKSFQICVNGAFLKSLPQIESPNLTEALHGELIDIYEINNGFAWGQLKNDNYVGYIDINAISENIINYSHKINTLRTYGFKEPKAQGQILNILSLGAQINPIGEAQNGFIDCGDLGFIFEKHIIKKDEFYDDPAQIAQWFLNAPYTWGGKQSIGVDCSGLAQISFAACGINLPRDARMQEFIGQEIEITPNYSGLKRNDLVFWKGHVAIMLDDKNIIHANGYTMTTSIEPLETANNRYIKLGTPLRNIRRII